MKLLLAALAALATSLLSYTARAADSLCVKYTTALLINDTSENQLQLMTMVVNLAVVGNATLNVSGILAPDGGLLGFFNGSMATTNENGKASKVDFLDGAAFYPNVPTNSSTYVLLEHLYQFFGSLLGCNATDFPPYEGVPDMYEVHKFMNLTTENNNYFISQVGASASALGMASDDVTTVANLLNTTFNRRCTPKVNSTIKVLNYTNPSTCVAPSCALADNPQCPNSTNSTNSTGGKSAAGARLTILTTAFLVSSMVALFA